MSRPDTAMVMAAGLGTRMQPLTLTRPKPLVPVLGKPLIDHVLDRLVAARVRRAVVNVHYKGDMLIAHLAHRKDIEIVISDEREHLLDTGGGTKKALPLLGEKPFFYVNSDSIWVEGAAPALDRLAAGFDASSHDAFLMMAPGVRAVGYDGLGDFTMDTWGRLTRRQKPRLAPFVWMGIQIIKPQLFEGTPDGAFSTNLLWDRAAAAGRLYGMRFDGTWLHVGTPEGVSEAEAFLREAARA
ncbi:MAG TPA: nucleotidyltransferase family protein [Micropepsaceae bacterium]|nr:nucleotidyltransferase family protein [Micropepsaceae bacterium]